MYLLMVQSDQFKTWSYESPKPIRSRTSETPQRSPAPATAAPINPARFSHRALQTMRQARLQMRRRPRPWPQVLSIGQLPGVATTDGLRAAGVLRANGGVPGQLPPSSRAPRVHLRDQPRTAAPTRGALDAWHAESAIFLARPDRCGIGRRTPCQYARSLARRQSNGFTYWRGNR